MNFSVTVDDWVVLVGLLVGSDFTVVFVARDGEAVGTEEFGD